MRKREIADGVTLYCADCRMVLPKFDSVDVLITDPPFGVDLGSQKWTTHRTWGRTKHTTKSNQYSSHDDSRDAWKTDVLPTLKLAIDRSERAAIFAANKMLKLMPQWQDLAYVRNPASCSMGAWGHQTCQPVALYGKRANHAQPLEKTFLAGNTEKIDHPCPRPIAWMTWLVGLASLPGETVLDPYMGAGSTGIAAVKLGRKFIGIESEPKYFDVACKRIELELTKPSVVIRKPTDSFWHLSSVLARV
jgi:DNA modification methylase